MTHEDIMLWAQAWHYPFLRIGDEDSPPTDAVLPHGLEHYQMLTRHERRLSLVSLRIQRINAALSKRAKD